MRFLLDTHVLIWWWLDEPGLSGTVRALLGDERETILVSPASAYEIANKVRIGKLDSMIALAEGFDTTIAADGFEPLPVRTEHALRAGLLAGVHRDPFDRIIAAQALIDDLMVITRDPAIAEFGCKVLW